MNGTRIMRFVGNRETPEPELFAQKEEVIHFQPLPDNPDFRNFVDSLMKKIALGSALPQGALATVGHQAVPLDITTVHNATVHNGASTLLGTLLGFEYRLAEAPIEYPLHDYPAPEPKSRKPRAKEIFIDLAPLQTKRKIQL